MRLFLYEYITGGGLLETDLNSAEASSSLLAEGRAMITALATDAARIPNVELVLLWDHRLPRLDLPAACLKLVTSAPVAAQAFAESSARSDGTIVIAPESDGILAQCAKTVLHLGGTLWGPAPELIQLCADKHRATEFLASVGVSAARGIRLEPNEPLPFDFPSPAVLKPIDGCGSQSVRLVTKDSDSQTWSSSHGPAWPARMEAFLPGQPVSVAILCGPEQQMACPVCAQHLSADGTFAYAGGSLPLAGELAERAEALACRAVRALPNPLGYVGVDLILGSAADGSEDAVIEINPRLTTSYVGLRHATPDNLAFAWAKIVQGERVSLTFSPKPIQFRADGKVSK